MSRGGKPPVTSTYQRLDFISSNPQGQTSGSSRELQLATIRSHAGSVRTSRLPRRPRRAQPSVRRRPPEPITSHGSGFDHESRNNPANALVHDLLQEKRDPFNMLGGVGLPDYTLHILEFGKPGALTVRVVCADAKLSSVTQTPFKPRGTCTLMMFVTRSLNEFAVGAITSIQLSLVLHSALSNCLWVLRSQVHNRAHLINNLYLRHQTSAIGLLRQDIQEHSDSPTLSSLFSVMALACHGGRIHDTTCNYDYPLSPLAYAQDVHIHGRGEQMAEHVIGAITLAQKMGGPTCVPDPNLISALET